MEIGDEAAGPVTSRQSFHTLLKLLPDTGPPTKGSGARSPGVAIKAASYPHPAIPVGAGKPCVQAHFLHPGAEALLEIQIEVPVRQCLSSSQVPPGILQDGQGGQGRSLNPQPARSQAYHLKARLVGLGHFFRRKASLGADEEAHPSRTRPG